MKIKNKISYISSKKEIPFPELTKLENLNLYKLGKIIEKYGVIIPDDGKEKNKKELRSLIQNHYNGLSFDDKKMMLSDLQYNLIHIKKDYFVDSVDFLEEYTLFKFNDSLEISNPKPYIWFSTIKQAKEYINNKEIGEIEINKVFENNNYLENIKNIVNNHYLSKEGINVDWSIDTVKSEFMAGSCFNFAYGIHEYLKKKGVDSNIVMLLDYDEKYDEYSLIHAYLNIGDKKYDINGEIDEKYLKKEFGDLAEGKLRYGVLKNEGSFEYHCITHNNFNTSGNRYQFSKPVVLSLEYCEKNNFINKEKDWVMDEFIKTLDS